MQKLADKDFDIAIIGPAMVWREPYRARVYIYNADTIITILMKRDGLDYETACDFFEDYIHKAATGLHSPIYVYPSEDWREWDDDPENIVINYSSL